MMNIWHVNIILNHFVSQQKRPSVIAYILPSTLESKTLRGITNFLKYKCSSLAKGFPASRNEMGEMIMWTYIPCMIQGRLDVDLGDRPTMLKWCMTDTMLRCALTTLHFGGKGR